MTPENLSKSEKLAAQIFFDVALQAAFALEDPNARFAVVFQEKSAMGAYVEKLSEVPSRVYETDTDDGYVAFQVRPPKSPALSRVLLRGELSMPLIQLLEGAMDKAKHFSMMLLGAAEPLIEIPDDSKDIGNRVYRLRIDSHLNAEHDVAVMFAWGLSSDKGTMMELSAWPIDKTADLNA